MAVRGPGSGLALSGRLEIPSRGGARERDGDAPAFAADCFVIADSRLARDASETTLQIAPLSFALTLRIEH